jgi:hypothetical protein
MLVAQPASEAAVSSTVQRIRSPFLFLLGGHYSVEDYGRQIDERGCAYFSLSLFIPLKDSVREEAATHLEAEQKKWARVIKERVSRRSELAIALGTLLACAASIPRGGSDETQRS